MSPSSDDVPTGWGSDSIASLVASLGSPYIAFTPGSSFRGLQDSLVNALGDSAPALLTCLHEEHAVAIAHGYAKVAGEPMVVLVHTNVGLMHASMAIYNAFCDRVPMLLLGGNGPADAEQRRPWIDWIHTVADLPALVRPFVKWDDSPASLPAALRSTARAWELALTPPMGPTYVVLDVTTQEERVLERPALPIVSHRDALDAVWANPAAVRAASEALRQARRPVILLGRAAPDENLFGLRVALAESLGARVITDLRTAGAFPSLHPLHVGGNGGFLGDGARAVLDDADVVLALDWVDLAGTLLALRSPAPPTVVDVSLNAYATDGWTKTQFERVEADFWLPTTTDTAVAQLLEALGDGPDVRAAYAQRPSSEESFETGDPSRGLTLGALANAIREVFAGDEVTLIRAPLGWEDDYWVVDSPLSYLGQDGGGGLGSGPGMTVGAALALRDGDRVPIAILGDGDFLMGVQALWTAAHAHVPLIVFVANNRSYFNDEAHQEAVARTRGRDVSRKGIGQRLDDPAPDIAGLATSLGLRGIGPVRTQTQLREAVAAAQAHYRQGEAVVVDVLVEQGYPDSMDQVFDG